MKRQLNTIISLLTLLFALSGAALGQEVTGALTGTVKDANGAAVKAAAVTVTDSAKKLVVRTTQTDDDGAFTVSELHVGVYDVTVEAPNFKKHLESNVKVDVGQRRAVMVTLEVGNVEEVVTVEANPVAVELSTPTVSTLINGEQARELSLNNRNWVQLITL
ncbi:MAG TPA: carboxypeptidase-like regulatory domain-containing protein, partial [Pyrinomonadaceae bacterium]|nr:carboxypeptidase-like regulatory domain-containing protein [Pyrinomonadaceae bacterium]